VKLPYHNQSRIASGFQERGRPSRPSACRWPGPVCSATAGGVSNV